MKPTLIFVLVVLVIAASACTAVSPAAPAAPATPKVPAATEAPAATETLAAATPTTAAPTANPPAATYSDPFAYCAAVGTLDQPDARYSGPKMPDVLAEGLRKASGAAADAPLDLFRGGGFWRCMDGKVYACFVGANLPCESKANNNQTPTAEETDYCKANPTSDFIPAAVTGHETVYEWACKDGKPAIVKQVFMVDPRGYIQEIWYPISQP